MKHINVPLWVISEYLNTTNSKYDELVEVDEEIYVRTVSGDYTKMRGIVRKQDRKLRVNSSDFSFICGENHILISESGEEVFAKNAQQIQTVYGISQIKTEYIGFGDLIDIAIDAPHLYVTPNGVIHHNTSLARAICNEINADLLYINASLETSIDVIRTKVVGFSSAVSFDGSMKVILMDELEGMSSSAMNSLKAVIEEFPNVRYIFTTNNPAKIIDPIKSRSVVIDFKIDSKERPKLAAQMFKRVMGILKEREIEFDQKVVAEVVNKFFPDFRRTLNEIQRYSASGKIDSGILVNASKTSYKELVKTLATKDFKAMRQWVGENSDMDPAMLFRDFYDNCYDYFEPATIPNVVLLLSDYQFKAIHAVDQSINLAAFLIEVMMSAKFKEI